MIVDFSRVIIFSHKDVESLNDHHKYLAQHIENYKVLDHFYLNEALLSYFKSLPENVKIYLFSDGALHNLPDISAKITSIFDRIIPASETGYKKHDPKAYERLVELLDIRPESAVFLDDKQANVSAAATIGIRAVRFMDNEQALQALRSCFATY